MPNYVNHKGGPNLFYLLVLNSNVFWESVVWENPLFPNVSPEL
jgi:hypothetical protein